MNSIEDNKNSENFSNKVYVYANLDLLFEFKSVLIAIIRNFNENSEKFKFSNINGKFFQSIELRNVKQFVNDVVEKIDLTENNLNKEREILNEFKSELIERIFNCKEFDCVKPRLFFLFRFYFLIQMIKEKVSVDDIVIKIYSNEMFFIDLIKKLNMLTLIENLFLLNQNAISLIYSNKDEIYLKESLEDELICLYFDNRFISIDNFYFLENLKLNSDDTKAKNEFSDKNLFFFPNSKIQEISENDIFKSANIQSIQYKFIYEKFLEKTCEKLNLSFENESSKYKEWLNREFINKYSKEFLSHDYKFLDLWKNYLNFNKDEIITVEGKVIQGFKRGSKLLGVPTANIEIKQNDKENLKKLLNGIYFGNYKFITSVNETVYKSVLSIGYNPYFNNSFKTLEVFLIDYEGEDFYDSECQLTIEGFLRNEAAFENFSELVTAINYDINVSYFK